MYSSKTMQIILQVIVGWWWRYLCVEDYCLQLKMYSFC